MILALDINIQTYLLTYHKLSELYCVHTSRIFGTGSPGLLFSAIVLAHARPNTTRSSSELAPSRFAPCTETHADSPALYRPRTTLSFPFTWSITCTSNKSSRQCDCYSTTTMCCTDLIKRLTTDPLQETLTIDYSQLNPNWNSIGWLTKLLILQVQDRGQFVHRILQLW